MSDVLKLLVLLVVVCCVKAYTGPDLPPGPYCGIRNECCSNRRDSCAHRILDTLCYCDQFCNRTSSHDDCCPDYEEVCLGTSPPGPVKMPCKHAGKLYFPGSSRAEKCNQCECVESPDGTSASWECERDACVITSEVLDAVNGDRLSWTAHNYTQFENYKLKDAIIYKLGTLPLSPATMRMGSIHHNKRIQYPRAFDSREHWPGYISPVYEQGWCGSDWAITIAGVISDRFAIQSNGAEKPVLSPQTFLSCNVRGQQACKGGHIDTAWNFAREHGVVTERCLGYIAARSQCPLAARSEEDGCGSGGDRSSRYRVGPAGRLDTERDIMYDIIESGPLHAIMTVYQDFFHYRGGVYRRSHTGDSVLQGLHSVRLVGWGEENGDKYWTVANSWGEDWGENGYFRIARGVNESGIESFIVTALVDVYEANYRK